MGLHISLTPEQERLVKDELASGHYETAEQVISEALRALQNRQSRGDASSSAAQRNAVRKMLEFLDKNSVPLENTSVKELLHEGHRHLREAIAAAGLEVVRVERTAD